MVCLFICFEILIMSIFQTPTFVLSIFSRNGNYDILYMAHQFLIYSCQVYFGYKLVNFLNLPQMEQTVERGFYLLGRWWCPTVDTSYRDICKYLFKNKLIYLHQ